MQAQTREEGNEKTIDLVLLVVASPECVQVSLITCCKLQGGESANCTVPGASHWPESYVPPPLPDDLDVEE